MEPENMNTEELAEHRKVLANVHSRIAVMKAVADNPDLYEKDHLLLALRDALSILIPSVVYTEGKAEIEGVIRTLRE